MLHSLQSLVCHIGTIPQTVELLLNCLCLPAKYSVHQMLSGLIALLSLICWKLQSSVIPVTSVSEKSSHKPRVSWFSTQFTRLFDFDDICLKSIQAQIKITDEPATGANPMRHDRSQFESLMRLQT